MQRSVTFDYDALGNPVVRRGTAGQITRVTLYDGGQIIADLDSAGYRQSEYVYDEGTDRPYAVMTGPTAVTLVRYFAQDDFGNVQGLFADSSHATQKVSYGDWGLPTVTGDTISRLTWKGLSYDPDVDLIYMRARWYDPAIGRFVSEDPAGLAGGINPYVFANNDPINGLDPGGLSEDMGCDVWLVQFAENGNVVSAVCISGGGSPQPMQPVVVTAAAPSDPFGGGAPWSHQDPPGLPANTTQSGSNGSARQQPNPQSLPSDPCSVYQSATDIQAICQRVTSPLATSRNQCTARCLANDWQRLVKLLGHQPNKLEQFDYLSRGHIGCYSACGYSLADFTSDDYHQTGTQGRIWFTTIFVIKPLILPFH